MSGRHRHLHTIQPYDYDRFAPPPRQPPSSRGIEYQDDSLSSINSDEETYLQKDKNLTKKKSHTKEKPSEKETPNTTAPKPAPPPPAEVAPSTNDRLNRLENMLEQLIKHNVATAQAAVPPAPAAPIVTEKGQGDTRYHLEARRHDFTTSMWINKIEEVAIQNNWAEKTVIKYMESLMSGIVKTWFKSLPNYDYTWPEWKLLISKTFPDNTDFVTSLKRLVTRLKQPDETITNYYFSKMYLIEACKISGEDAVSCLIDGLNNAEIQEQAKTQNYLTPETLFSQFLAVLPDYTVDYAPQLNTTASSDEANWYYPGPNAAAATEVAEDARFEQPRPLAEYEGDNHESEGPPPKRATSVHARLDKRFIKPTFRSYPKPTLTIRICDICGNRGHIAKYCRTKMYLCKRSTDTAPEGAAIACLINGRKMVGLIDTGSTVVTIKREAIGDSILEPCDWLLEGFGASCTKAIGRVKIELEVDGVRREIEGVVVDDQCQDVDVLIGRSFLDRVAMVMRRGSVLVYEDVCDD